MVLSRLKNDQRLEPAMTHWPLLRRKIHIFTFSLDFNRDNAVVGVCPVLVVASAGDEKASLMHYFAVFDIIHGDHII